tara:strand:+ start:3088 stop:3339 length:252 start_codon:yes stop_codon:yes gene_type:complete
MELKMIICIVCKEPMPELRLTKYGYKSCVECSTVGAYQAVSTQHGEGDHTWNDIQIMTPEQMDVYNSKVNQKPKLDSYKDIDA